MPHLCWIPIIHISLISSLNDSTFCQHTLGKSLCSSLWLHPLSFLLLHWTQETPKLPAIHTLKYTIQQDIWETIRFLKVKAATERKSCVSNVKVNISSAAITTLQIFQWYCCFLPYLDISEWRSLEWDWGGGDLDSMLFCQVPSQIIGSPPSGSCCLSL